MDLGIDGKRVLVTGASQGLGRRIALDFAEEGCKVAVIARNAEKLQNLVDQMEGHQKGHAFYAVDLMLEGAPTAAVNELTAKDGPFDIVIHNVGGTLQVRNPLSPMEEWYRVWKYNVGIAIEINDIVIPYMQAEQWGRIIHISSIAGIMLMGSGPYAAAKAYLNAYTKVLGRAVAPTGVVVSALLPGAFFAEGGHWDNVRKTNLAKEQDFLGHHQAIGRLGTPEEISSFALFMASKWSTFATASLITVDGGTM
ncbi:MAG TPA: NAD(P)-dependent oxidoreductase [Deltaproteobacteria bacterium]|nr:NAD(P)-dependent oxidoreductase [Deltaproteobacteria bacterium]